MIPMSSPDITDAEREAIAEVLATPYLSMGPMEKEFERLIAEYVGARHAIAVSSGTTGLHLCIRAAEISDGDWVITTPFSFVASSNVILYERAVPVFVDVRHETGNIDPLQLTQAIEDLSQGGKLAKRWLPRQNGNEGGELRAVLAVDVFGQPADYAAISPIVASHDLVLIEDSCEALGARYKDQPAGRLGKAGVFAFYPNKQMTTGEGGVVVTDDDQWEAMIRAMRNQGRAPGDTWLKHTHLGYNYRLNELSAALGVVQMGRFGELLQKREQVAEWYRQGLETVREVTAPTVGPNTSRVSWFVYVVRFDPGVDRDEMIRKLKDQGIPSRPYFSPIHLQPYMVERFGYRKGDFPVTEDLAQRGLALPFSSVMKKEEVERVVQAIKFALKDE
jgi:perosamine synthetase